MASIYYLSFHKAPPLAISENETYISIAPTIHNDLREDVYTSEDGIPLSITVAWLIRSENETKLNRFEFLEEACMIPWLDSTQAYKNVQVKIPSNRPIGADQRLHLALYIDQGKSTKSWQFDLLHDRLDNLSYTIFVPVLSAPVIVRKKENRQGQLTDLRSRSVFRLFEIGADVPILMEEEIGFALEGHLWDAALHMVRWLHLQLKGGEKSLLQQMLHDFHSLRILELGTGTGFVSIALSAMLSKEKASIDDHCASRISIHATDLPAAMDVLLRNQSHNKFTPKEINLSAGVLDWEDVKGGENEIYDLIFVADCTYNPDYFDALCHAIRSSLRPEAICLLAKKHRHIDEDNLWNSMKIASLHHKLVHGYDARQDEHNSHALIGWGLYKITVA